MGRMRIRIATSEKIVRDNDIAASPQSETSNTNIRVTMSDVDRIKPAVLGIRLEKTLDISETDIRSDVAGNRSALAKQLRTLEQKFS